MIAQDQNDAMVSISMTSFTVNDARANSASNEKSISFAAARVEVSIILCSPVGPRDRGSDWT